MTWSKAVTIWCDAESCDEWIRPGAATVQKARDQAEGWKYNSHLDTDICPDCWEAAGGDSDAGE